MAKTVVHTKSTNSVLIFDTSLAASDINSIHNIKSKVIPRLIVEIPVVLIIAYTCIVSNFATLIDSLDMLIT
jgi:hypothetical protein